MLKLTYNVVFEKGEWKIRVNDKYYGPFYTQSYAAHIAMVAANEARKSGFDADVLIQGKNSNWTAEANFSADPYPAAA